MKEFYMYTRKASGEIIKKLIIAETWGIEGEIAIFYSSNNELIYAIPAIELILVESAGVKVYTSQD